MAIAVAVCPRKESGPTRMSYLFLLRRLLVSPTEAICGRAMVQPGIRRLAMDAA